MPLSLESISSQALPPLDSHDGIHLYRRQWLHPAPRGAVLLVHGLGEHSGRYHALARWFWRRGYTVQAYDQRGHGRSGGARGGLPQQDDLLRDLTQVFQDLAASQALPPLLFGHSLGGLVCARAVLEQRVSPAGLILSAPALQSRVGRPLQALAALLARFLPQLRLHQALPKALLSHDPSVEPAVRADTYCHDRITPALAHFIFTAGHRARAEAAQLTVPTLLLVAGDDHLVDPAGSLDFAARAAPGRLQSALFASAYHELCNEIATLREAVLTTLGDWLEGLE